MDLGDLVRLLVGDRDASSAKLYGSEPPKLDTVWNAIRNKQIANDKWIEVVTKHRNFRGKEKQVDAQLLVDITFVASEQKDVDTFIIDSGDADFMPFVSAALERHFNVEIASFSAALSNVENKQNLKKYLSEGQLKVIKCEDIILICSFEVLEYKQRIPRER